MNKEDQILTIQSEVDKAVRKVGGYWRPLSALARLQEEIGELAEELIRFRNDGSKITLLGGELADLFVITTCIANQYCANLQREYGILGSTPFQEKEAELESQDVNTFLYRLLIKAGELSRVLNHLEGDKVAKKGATLPRAAQRIAEFHNILGDFSNHLGISLSDNVQTVLDRSKERDARRFSTYSDPITEETLDRFQQAIITKTQCVYASSAKVWGGKTWNPSRAMKENVENNLAYLRRFIKVSVAEQLDGFVIEVVDDNINDLDSVCLYFNNLLNALVRFEPPRIRRRLCYLSVATLRTVWCAKPETPE